MLHIAHPRPGNTRPEEKLIFILQISRERKTAHDLYCLSCGGKRGAFFADVHCVEIVRKYKYSVLRSILLY